MNDLIQKIRDLAIRANRDGVPLPVMKDTVTQKGSLTYTMTVLSFTTCLIGQIGKISHLLS